MKKVFIVSSLLFFFACSIVSAQFTNLKKFDFKLLKNKVLYVQKYSETSDYAKQLLKKGNFAKLKTIQEKITYHNKIWSEAMAKSSYDATPYEIKEYDSKKIFKEKNEEAIVLMYTIDRYRNVFAELWIAGPKRVAIANTLINGLDLSDPNDLRLMINMLNYSLNECAEIDAGDKDKSRSALMTKYKQNMINFYEKLPQQTFYVVKEEDTDKPQKAAEKNKEIAEAMKGTWDICKYELISETDLQKKKDESVADGFYWKSFKYYTNNILMTYKLKFLLTIDRDEVVFFYYGLGNATFKASTAKDLQEKIVEKGEKYKKQLEVKK